MVTIYSTPTCVYCKALKEYFDSKNVQYQEIANVELPFGALMEYDFDGIRFVKKS